MCRSSMGGLQYVLVVNTRFIFVLGALLLSDGSQELGRGGGVSSRAAVHMGHCVHSESRDGKRKYKVRKEVLHLSGGKVTGSDKYSL